MVRFFIFIFCLFLENLILPAFLGPKQFFITPLFLIGLLVYGNGQRTLLYQVIPLVFIAEFFVGENFGRLIIPFGLTGIIYVIIDKFVNLSQNRGHNNKTLSSLMVGILIIILFSFIYAGLFIFFNASHDFNISWHEFIIFLESSLLILVIWSIIISILFKYVLSTATSKRSL